MRSITRRSGVGKRSRRVDYENADTPETHRAVQEVFSLPVFPTTSFEDLDYVAHAIRETLTHLRT